MVHCSFVLRTACQCEGLAWGCHARAALFRSTDLRRTQAGHVCLTKRMFSICFFEISRDSQTRRLPNQANAEPPDKFARVQRLPSRANVALIPIRDPWPIGTHARTRSEEKE